MTEEEFRILEQRMRINRGIVPECSPAGSLKPGEECACTRDPVEWPEHMIEAECTRLLEQDGWTSFKTTPVSDRGRGIGFGEKGMADYLYIRYTPMEPGEEMDCLSASTQTLWVEYKSAKGKPAKHQTKWHTIERARGALTLIAGVDFPASVAGFVEYYRASGLNRGRV